MEKLIHRLILSSDWSLIHGKVSPRLMGIVIFRAVREDKMKDEANFLKHIVQIIQTGDCSIIELLQCPRVLSLLINIVVGVNV